MIEFRTRITAEKIKDYNSIHVVVDENIIKIVGRTLFLNSNDEIITSDKVLQEFDVEKRRKRYRDMGVDV